MNFEISYPIFQIYFKFFNRHQISNLKISIQGWKGFHTSKVHKSLFGLKMYVLSWKYEKLQEPKIACNRSNDSTQNGNNKINVT